MQSRYVLRGFSEKKTQINKNAEFFFALFRPFLVPITHYPSRERQVPVLSALVRPRVRACSATPAIVPKYLPKKPAKTFGQSRFFIGHLAIVLRLPVREMKCFTISRVVFVLLVYNFEFTKTPNDESFLAAYDYCPAHPTPSHTRSGACLKFRGLWLLARGCSCLHVKCKRSVGGSFLSHFVYPQISTKFDQIRPLSLC